MQNLPQFVRGAMAAAAPNPTDLLRKRAAVLEEYNATGLPLERVAKLESTAENAENTLSGGTIS